MSRNLFGMFAAAIAALLSGCVGSETPLINGAKPLLGEQFAVHLYENFVDKKASDFHASIYQWKEGQYVRVYGLARDAKRFVAEPLTGNDFVIQSTDDDRKAYFYLIGRRLIPGVYLIFSIDQTDADDVTREGICGRDRSNEICLVNTREQLLTLARATTASSPKNPALGVVLTRPSSF